MTVQVDGRDVTGDEAILADGACVGHVTSGGYAHHVGRSVAFGYVKSEFAAHGQSLEIEIDGRMWPARVEGAPLHDPSGARMRG
jgi:dimethylglycine dehydrogenase